MTKQKIKNLKGWKEARLGDKVRLIYGSGLPKEKRNFGEFPVYGSNGIVGWHERYLIKSPGIIVGRKGSIGLVIWSDKNFWPIDTAYYVESDRDIRLRWLYYKLQTLKLNKMNSASGVPGLNREEVYKIKILVPSQEEQEKIAEILSKVDEDIEKTEGVIKNTERLKKGLMQELLTRGIGHKKFKKTKLGEIPEEWEAVKLCDIGSNFIGLTYSPRNVVANDGVLVFRSSNIKNGSVVYNDNVYVNSKIPNNLITKKGDILLCTRNGSRNLIGKCAYITDDSAGHSFGAFMSVYRTKYSEFIYQVFLSDIFKNQVKKYLGATINQITNTSLNSFIVPFPNIKEQKQIAEILSSVDDKIEINKQIKNKLIQLKKGLMQDLLSGKVRTI